MSPAKLPNGLNNWVASDKPVRQDFVDDNTVLDEKVLWKSAKGAANGVAVLDSSVKVPVTQLPDGSTTAKGIVQLVNSTTNSSTTLAATAYSVKVANDYAGTMLSRTGGNMTGSVRMNGVNRIYLHDGDSCILGETTTKITYSANEHGFWKNGGSALAPINASEFRVGSSRRFKENIRKLTQEEAERILTIQPAAFTMKADETERICFGFIAEDVEMIDSGYVACDEDGKPFAIDYNRFVAPMLALVQRQQTAIAALEARVSSLEKG